MIGYSVVIPTRALPSEYEIYKRCFESLLDQTVKPRAIYVCLSYSKPIPYIAQDWSNFWYLTLPSYVPPNEKEMVGGIPKINLGLTHCKQDEHVVISGDDCYYPPDYFKILLEQTEKYPDIGIISGKVLENNRFFVSPNPSGSGRLYTNKVAQKIFPHPYINCGETLFLYQSEMLGFRNVMTDLTYFEHLRPRKKTSLLSDGKACYELGYPIGFTAMRSIYDSFQYKNVKGLNVFFGYVDAMLRRTPRVDITIQDRVRWKLRQRFKLLF